LEAPSESDWPGNGHRTSDGAAVGRFRPADQPNKRGLPRTIPAKDADTLAATNNKVNTIENGYRSESSGIFLMYVLELNHCGITVRPTLRV
jgi:hypothetical protein